MIKKNKAYLFAFVSIIFWASTATITKLLLKGLDSIQILCISSFFASLTIFLMCLFAGKLNEIKEYTFKDFVIMFFTGIIGIFGYRLFLTAALFYLPAQEAFILNYLWPIMIVIFTIIILKEKITARKIIAIITSFIGIVIVVTKGNFTELNLSSPMGVLLAILGAVCYGFFSVIVKKHKYDKTVSMMFYCAFSFILSFIVMNVISEIPKLDIMQTVGLAFNGIFVTAIAFITWALALKYGDTIKIANLAFITPFLSLIYIAIFLKERISIYSILGLVIIVMGILIQNKDKKDNINETDKTKL